ncbi:MAG: cation transporter [Gemmatimonadota bacterium]|jgi:copper chaperone CopZ|nr:MAG: cation transporter [Gemmatimonadota bacterium]
MTSTRHLTLVIEGMKCEGCAAAVREALDGVPGVEEVEVRLDEGRAIASVAPDAAGARLIGAVEAAGYKASLA